jgi:arylsulfatase A-like enzyme
MRYASFPVARTESKSGGVEVDSMCRPVSRADTAAVALAAALIVPLLAACGARAPAGPPEKVVLVTLDTFRADHLKSFGYPRDTAPFLESLLARGVLFRRVVSSCSRTAPAHASIFTGLYPFQHGVMANGDRLPPKAWTISSAAGDAGYTVAGFSAVKFLAGRVGFVEGDDLNVRRGGPRGVRNNLTAEQQVDRVTEWLGRRGSKDRVFLWVHFFDAHSWRNDRLTRTVYARPEDGADHAALHDLVVAKRGVPATFFGSKENLLAAYDAYDARIRFIDLNLRRLHEYFDRRGWLDRTLWLVVADHGEGIGAHSYAGHSLRLYEDQVRVPLAIVDGARRFPPRVIDTPVRSVDILPTFVELIGGRTDIVPAGVAGSSLSGYLAGDSDSAMLPRTALSQRRKLKEGEEEQSGLPEELNAIQNERYKLILGSDGGAELYDLLADRWERSNLAGTGIADQPALAAELDRMLATMARLRDPGTGAPVDAETERELRSLGYIR